MLNYEERVESFSFKAFSVALDKICPIFDNLHDL